MRIFLRYVRDAISDIRLRSTSYAEVCGIKLKLWDPQISSRMRYVLSKGYERDDAMLLKGVVDHDDSVLELGSSIGFMALYAIKELHVKKYVMVEANSDLNSLVRDNFQLNGVHSCQIINAAAASFDGELAFRVNHNFWSSSIMDRGRARKILPVEAVTLQTLLKRLDFKPNVLVMDIEGGETDINVSDFSCFTKLIIEFHPKLVGKENIIKLKMEILRQGFKEVASAGASVAYKKINCD